MNIFKKRIIILSILTLVLTISPAVCITAFSAENAVKIDFTKKTLSDSIINKQPVKNLIKSIHEDSKSKKGTMPSYVAKEKIMANDTANRVLDLEFSGSVNLSVQCAVYQITDNKVIQRAQSDILVGAENVYVFFDTKRQVCLIVIDGEIAISNIRVGITPEMLDSLEHNTIEIVSKDGFKLTDKVAGKSFGIEPDVSVTFSTGSTPAVINVSKNGKVIYSTINRLYALPVSDTSQLQVLSIKRSYGSPLYRGAFEIKASQAVSGKLRLINELPMEKYLYQVVPSEMPASFGLEALKAQAVAARTYALNDCLVNTSLASQGILLYDSVMSQVYNNSLENSLSSQAVDETANMVLMKDGKYVDCRYYSTSGGFGASMHEVWSDSVTKAFPATPTPYLMSRSYTYDPSDNSKMFSMDTSNEDAINAFYKNLSYTGYDSNSYYFRWKVALSKKELQNTINKNIKLRYAADPLFILTKDATGSFVSKPIPDEGIGNLNNIYVARRGTGGNMMELVVEGSTGTYKIIKEYNIRFTIRPNKTDTCSNGDILAYRMKGGSNNYDPEYTIKNPSILFSAFCAFDIEKDSGDTILSVTFYGGGNGHGVGMSQFGAQCLGLEKGFTYDRILKEYYTGAELVNYYTTKTDSNLFEKTFKK